MKYEIIDYPKFEDIVQDSKISVEVKGLGKAQDSLLVEMHCGEGADGCQPDSDGEPENDDDDGFQETVETSPDLGQEGFQSVVPVDDEAEADLRKELDDETVFEKATPHQRVPLVPLPRHCSCTPAGCRPGA